MAGDPLQIPLTPSSFSLPDSRNRTPSSHDTQSVSSPTHNLISELRKNLSPSLNSLLTNTDCHRFLTARSDSIPDAVTMIQNWHEWRHTLLDPIPPYNIRMSPNILLATPSPLYSHPFRSMLPLNHCCVSKNNLPIYWEKTGAIQSIFGEIKRRFTPLELFQYHLQSNELFENRLFHLTKQRQQNQQQQQHSDQMSPVLASESLHQYIIIFDMKGIHLTLDLDSIWYIKQLLETDQQYYPDHLYKLLIINSPWYFNAIFQIFKPFISLKTCEKIVILGTDYFESLEEFIDLEMIPVEYGGTYPEMVWELTPNAIHGTSLEQIEEFIQHRLHHLKDHLTVPEMISLHQAYYIKKTEYRVKWLLEYRLNQLLQSLTSAPSPHQDQHHDHDVNQKEIQLNIQQLRDELLRIHPTNQTREDLNHLRSSLHHNLLVSDNAAMGIGLRTERPLVRVCDLIQTEIVGVERRSQYHNYVINVRCRNNPSWQIKRRYSQFAKFHKIICRLIPTHRSLSFPPKRLFKMSTDVASSRRIMLGQYLISVIDSCLSYDTPEQDLIFKFLGGYDHIINDITEGYPAVNDWSQETYPVLPSSLTGTSTDGAQGDRRPGRSGGNGEIQTRGSASQDEIHSSSLTTTATAGGAGGGVTGVAAMRTGDSNALYWKTAGAPFAAVFLSACMIVISFMGHIIK